MRGLAAADWRRAGGREARLAGAGLRFVALGGSLVAGTLLGVATLSYLPYCVFNYASPALSVLYGITGFRIERTEPASEEAQVVVSA